MPRSALLAPVLLAVMLLAPAGLAGQAIPRTNVFEIAPDAVEGVAYEYEYPGALAFEDGFVAYSTVLVRQGDESFQSVQVRLLDANGHLGAWFDPPVPPQDCYPVASSVARESSGDLFFTWEVDGFYPDAEAWVQRYRPGEPESSECWRISEPDIIVRDPVAASGGGRTVVTWLEHEEGYKDKQTWVKARVFAAGGAEVAGELVVTNFPQTFIYHAVGVDAGGRFVILWWNKPHYCNLVGQRFTPDGVPLGGQFTLVEDINDISEECLIPVVMTMAPDGSFAAAWTNWDGAGELRRFRPQGIPEGAPFSFNAYSFSIAGDRHGNLALMRPEGVQLFNRHLVRQGPLVTAPWNQGVALGDRLLAVWTGPLKPGDPSSILGRIWDVRRDADACAYRGNRFLFDTAGDGGEPDVIIPFGSGQGIPLLGDFNGDGRDDPCLYQGGRFLCDTAHDGALAEKQSPPFGKPGDVPLLGDLDGDGRDDPCLRRGKSFLCDADRNGKTDRSITFGQPGDQVVIGDMDGDGRDDPCVVRKGAFLCDSAHNGGAAETQLSLSAALSGLPTGTPALGDIDGDGRDDPCVFTAGRLLCGLFTKGAKLPASIVDRPFGEPGDAFLLGDLDAF